MVICLLCDRVAVEWAPYCLAHDLELWLCGWWQDGAPSRMHNMQGRIMHSDGAYADSGNAARGHAA